MLEPSSCISPLLFSIAFSLSLICSRAGAGIRLSFDHKPSLPEEVERISSAGGFVAMGRVNGILAVSRALGDHMMKKFVICDPFIHELELTPEDTHIIVACDGVWDVMTDDQAAAVVAEASADCKKVSFLLHSLSFWFTDNYPAFHSPFDLQPPTLILSRLQSHS
jgi:protein phosphatase PTC1